MSKRPRLATPEDFRGFGDNFQIQIYYPSFRMFECFQVIEQECSRDLFMFNCAWVAERRIYTNYLNTGVHWLRVEVNVGCAIELAFEQLTFAGVDDGVLCLFEPDEPSIVSAVPTGHGHIVDRDRLLIKPPLGQKH